MCVGDVVNKYHGFGGGVKGICCYDDGGEGLFAACGLDRYLRVYTMERPMIIYKVLSDHVIWLSMYGCRNT